MPTNSIWRGMLVNGVFYSGVVWLLGAGLLRSSATDDASPTGAPFAG